MPITQTQGSVVSGDEIRTAIAPIPAFTVERDPCTRAASRCAELAADVTNLNVRVRELERDKTNLCAERDRLLARVDELIAMNAQQQDAIDEFMQGARDEYSYQEELERA